MSKPPAPYLKGAKRRKAAQKARALYETGLTIHAVALKLGRSYGCARQLLIEADAPLHPPGNRPHATS
ncbi:helix-turn-helix domain-containing protein [Streptomyces sp. NPDC020801]|uniref:helix-turn-helix domain-containing protein n=1 Tax=Streptomyces sp. NPDC020801 TaxID=3365093 RepID=UPI003789CC46